MAGIAKDGTTPQDRRELRQSWTVLGSKACELGVHREVRMSPSGIVVVEDTLPDGTIRHTRITPNGRYGQTIEDTPRKAWLAARGLVR